MNKNLHSRIKSDYSPNHFLYYRTNAEFLKRKKKKNNIAFFYNFIKIDKLIFKLLHKNQVSMGDDAGDDMDYRLQCHTTI